MNAGNSMGDRIRMARLGAAQGNTSLGTYAGAAEAIGVESPDTVGRWERDESTPTNFNMKQMALVYHAPELMANYCAMSCPIGQGRMPEINLSPVAQLTLKLRNSSRSLEDDIGQLMIIAEDGVIDEDEQEKFHEIMSRLKHLSSVISTFQVMGEKLARR